MDLSYVSNRKEMLEHLLKATDRMDPSRSYQYMVDLQASNKPPMVHIPGAAQEVPWYAGWDFYGWEEPSFDPRVRQHLIDPPLLPVDIGDDPVYKLGATLPDHQRFELACEIEGVKYNSAKFDPSILILSFISKRSEFYTNCISPCSVEAMQLGRVQVTLFGRSLLLKTGEFRMTVVRPGIGALCHDLVYAHRGGRYPECLDAHRLGKL